MEERWKDFDNDKANFEASLNKDEELLRRMSVDVNLKEWVHFFKSFSLIIIFIEFFNLKLLISYNLDYKSTESF